MNIGDKIIYRIEKGVEAYLFTDIKSVGKNGVIGQYGEVPHSLIVAFIDTKGRYKRLQEYGKVRNGPDGNIAASV